MEWGGWNGKQIFLRLKTGKVYSGKVVDVDDSDKNIIFITIIDKFQMKVTFVHSEIIELKEEDNGLGN